jgi:DNA-binding beta-propeller fold protein YncE
MDAIIAERCEKRADTARQFVQFLSVLMLLLCLYPITAWSQENVSALRLAQTMVLPNVKGRIDHLAIDLEKQRLFVAALGNNTLEVIDLAAGKWGRSAGGLTEPQGLLYLAEPNRVFVTNGGDGSLKILDGQTLAPTGNVKFPEDADNIRYDQTRRQLYVGYGSGALGIVNPDSGKRVGDIPLSSHPESFQLEATGSRIFVNVPAANQVAVVERDKRTVIATWPLGSARANFPMALDETGHRLFVGCREPAKVLVYDTTSGKITASMDVARDIDDIFFDSALKRLYLSCGEGFLHVFQQLDTDNYFAIQKLHTAAGARTCLFVPEHRRVYLAVPSRSKQPARINVYDVGP